MKRYPLADIEAGIPSEAAAPAQRFSLPDVITKDRHKAMYLTLRKLKRMGLGLEAAVAAVHIENKNRCQPPLDWSELDGYVRRVWNQPDPPAKDVKRDETVTNRKPKSKASNLNLAFVMSTCLASADYQCNIH